MGCPAPPYPAVRCGVLDWLELLRLCPVVPCLEFVSVTEKLLSARCCDDRVLAVPDPGTVIPPLLIFFFRSLSP